MKALLRRIADVPLMIKAGAMCGFCAGLPLGMMVSAGVGLLFGVSLGVTVGIMAGIVMDRDEKLAQHRTRELDDIIGVTKGSLGAPPSVPPEPPGIDPWITEWMTPPPPQVG